MLRNGLAALSLLAVLGWAAPARAQESVFDSVDAPTHTLGLAEDNADDLQLVHFRRGFHGHHGFYGYRPYYRPGFAFSFSVNVYPRYYYRPFYPAYYYRPYYSYGIYYRPYFYGVYYYPSYYYAPPVYYGWCADVLETTPAYRLGELPTLPPATPYQGTPQMPKADENPRNGAPPADGTFPYDGGPANPVPLPDGSAQPAPLKKAPPRTAPPKSYLVSVPDRTEFAKDAFRAYGEAEPRPAVTFRTSTERAPAPAPSATTRHATGFAFPAYGEVQQKTTFATSR